MSNKVDNKIMKNSKTKSEKIFTQKQKQRQKQKEKLILDSILNTIISYGMLMIKQEMEEFKTSGQDWKYLFNNRFRSPIESYEDDFKFNFSMLKDDLKKVIK